MFIRISNLQNIPIDAIPVLSYDDFLEANSSLPSDERYHCLSYFARPLSNGIQLICCMADDTECDVMVSSSIISDTEKPLHSFTAQHGSFQMFERELHEQYGVSYIDHPWLKPLHGGCADYPFFAVAGEALHEVGVGPIHAGIIEPGYFRFTCNGERIVHLEIQLGYQRRGVERLMVEHRRLSYRTQLAESIAGDSTVAHGTAFATLWESLCGSPEPLHTAWARTVALELERIAIHTGDLSALCGDIAYQLGSAVYGRLRTPVINFLQEWTGSRFARTLLAPGRLPYPFTEALAMRLSGILTEFVRDFKPMGETLLNMPGALSRFERAGTVSREVALKIGAVGMAARASGQARDLRLSHPSPLYRSLHHAPLLYESGDVLARVKVRHYETLQSVKYLLELLKHIPSPESAPTLSLPAASSFCLSMVEGWRGEVCHCALSDEKGELVRYKVCDPSFHNWQALAMAVRNNEISDFPICNKSFNLSYCGFDL